HAELSSDGLPGVYLPWWVGGGAGRVFLAVRGAGAGAVGADGVREAIRSVDPAGAVAEVRAMRGRVADATATQRVAMKAALFFGLVSLFLACLGLYAVIAVAVGRRTREIATRRALGASGGTVTGQILRNGMSVLAIGAVAGMLGAAAVTRVVAGFMFGVEPLEVPTLLAALGVVSLAGVVSTGIPALRALRVDPARALREG
ncbi:MAG: FtsX-like permease family protein, partial [Gemmatimonadetes bacterium]|nr:FtsX-like permease family protein [Gemmatimonadota bacterium]NIR77473.1 FtsX-like permease family protein [Gemmatimonadota bacterium]NIT85997.1 FtsX-like permease family protein [Gemmatimonadota bacterium]NIU29817.1 FtsX-like permease family protein [Gemmatimonadota bacterium]NIU34839.1 FtsX-like permease family protein [Gemmatimonadota bacterium]